MIRLPVLALCLALGAPDPATAPGYEAFTKRELWEASVRWRAKAQDAKLALLEEQVSHAATKEKLAVRTSTAIRDLVAPPDPPEPTGHSTEILLLSSAVALIAGAVIGALALSKNEPSTVVVR